MKLYTKCERNRAISGAVITTLMFDLMTFEHLTRNALRSEIIRTKSELGQPISSRLTAIFCY